MIEQPLSPQPPPMDGGWPGELTELVSDNEHQQLAEPRENAAIQPVTEALQQSHAPLLLPSQRLLQQGNGSMLRPSTWPLSGSMAALENVRPLPELKPIRSPANDENSTLSVTDGNNSLSLQQDGSSALQHSVVPQQAHCNSLFVIKPTSVWSEEARLKPKPNALFDVIWHEGELCIMFSDSNAGKSILGVQVGESISTGNLIPGFKKDAPAQKVLLCDFELSDKQFEARYSDNYQDHYFKPGSNDNFLRAEINPEADLPKGFPDFESYLCHSLEVAVLETGARVLIIDNITYLGSDTEKAKNALPLMKQLQALKKKHGLSMLVLAHTPKRDNARPITKNDIQGSKMFVNFCDSAFAIGVSAQDPSVRYLKQVKQRQTEERYGSENVVLCQIAKRHNFLQFEFIGFGSESQHLRQPTDGDREQQISEAVEMRSQGKSNVYIATHFGVSEGAVRKWLKKSESGDAPF